MKAGKPNNYTSIYFKHSVHIDWKACQSQPLMSLNFILYTLEKQFITQSSLCELKIRAMHCKRVS